MYSIFSLKSFEPMANGKNSNSNIFCHFICQIVLFSSKTATEILNPNIELFYVFIFWSFIFCQAFWQQKVSFLPHRRVSRFFKGSRFCIWKKSPNKRGSGFPIWLVSLFIKRIYVRFIVARAMSEYQIQSSNQFVSYSNLLKYSRSILVCTSFL